MDTFYSVTVSKFEHNTGMYEIKREDGDHEFLIIKNEIWRHLQSDQLKIVSISSIQDEALEFHLKVFAH